MRIIPPLCYTDLMLEARQGSMVDGVQFTIQIEGKLGERWTGWFAGMTITTAETTGAIPITTLTGPLADQAALLGILYKLHNLGLDIVLVKRETPASPADSRL
jgi:hypothetical protein